MVIYNKRFIDVVQRREFRFGNALAAFQFNSLALAIAHIQKLLFF